jgi:hypothetical protein
MRAAWMLPLVFLAQGTACGRSALKNHMAAAPGDDGGDSAVPAGGGAGTTGLGHGGQAGVGAAGGGQSGSGGGTSLGGRSGAGGVGGGGSFAAGGGAGMSSGGTLATGGAHTAGSGGARPTGGVMSTGGLPGGAGGTAGNADTGGNTTTGGTITTGGTGPGGAGGAALGGAVGTGGRSPTGGVMSAGGRGGVSAAGGAGSGGISGPRCGDGTLDANELCDLGKDNADLPAFQVSQGGATFAATPVARIPSAADFYNYTSVSAHTGFETLGTSHLFLYFERSTAKLSLIAIHGIDENTSGEQQPRSQVQLVFSGLPYGASISVSDDDGEFTMTSETSATGDWRFTNNTDGGAISDLAYPSQWEIYVSPAFVAGIDTWDWLQADGSIWSLDRTQPLTIKATASRSQCRRDCSIPRCGDGILDGGEICDGSDENCAADCMSFQ